MELVADSSSDVELSFAVVSVTAIQVECFGVLRPQGQTVGTRFYLFHRNFVLPAGMFVIFT